jgi:hypothetical protein
MKAANSKVYSRVLSTVWIDKDGVLFSVFKHIPRNLARCKERTAFIKSLTKNEAVCTIMDVSLSGIMDGEARRHIKKEFPSVYKALAVVAVSPLGKLIATLATDLAPASVPTHIFEDIVKAKDWIKQYL